LAAAESDPTLKDQLSKQAAAYRNLAEDRAKQIGVSLRPIPPGGTPSQK
jgi:hypothetical protein